MRPTRDAQPAQNSGIMVRVRAKGLGRVPLRHLRACLDILVFVRVSVQTEQGDEVEFVRNQAARRTRRGYNCLE